MNWVWLKVYKNVILAMLRTAVEKYYSMTMQMVVPTSVTLSLKRVKWISRTWNRSWGSYTHFLWFSILGTRYLPSEQAKDELRWGHCSENVETEWCAVRRDEERAGLNILQIAQEVLDDGTRW